MENDLGTLKPEASIENSLTQIALNSFEARLKLLEHPKSKSSLELVQKNASLLALVVGIILSLISLFDIFWEKPKEELIRNIGEFNKAVNSITSLRQSMIQLHFQSNNSEMKFALNSMVAPQVQANIQYATALLPKLGDHVGIPQLIVLINEAMNIYDWKSADILVERAIVAKNSVPSLQSEAFRYKARLMFSTGKLQEGRRAFEDSLNAIRNESAFGIFGNRAYIVSDWILSEFAFGDCVVGTERIRQFVEYIGHPQVMPLLRSGLVSTLKTNLAQVVGGNQRCSIPSELLALNID
jgi:hypothetical protein